MSSTILAVLACFVGIVASSTAPSKDCGSWNAELIRAEFEPPCSENNCVFRRGDHVTVKAHFLPKIDSNIITADAYQIEPFFNVKTPLVQGENLCGNYNITCPLKAGVMQYGLLTATVASNTPNFKTILQIEFNGDKDKLFCRTCPVEIR